MVTNPNDALGDGAEGGRDGPDGGLVAAVVESPGAL